MPAGISLCIFIRRWKLVNSSPLLEQKTSERIARTARVLAVEKTGIERPNRLIADFEQTSTQKATAVNAHVAAKINMDETVARSLQAVRQLDALIRNKFNGDPAILANWTRASHVAYRKSNHSSEPPPADSNNPPATNS